MEAALTAVAARTTVVEKRIVDCEGVQASDNEGQWIREGVDGLCLVS
jgi:hypothetical protein